jgi:hypothetical protein
VKGARSVAANRTDGVRGVRASIYGIKAAEVKEARLSVDSALKGALNLFWSTMGTGRYEEEPTAENIKLLRPPRKSRVTSLRVRRSLNAGQEV